MALSRVCEIEIDSTFRTSNSNSPTDFEFQLPYTFPNYKNAQIQLGYAFIPNTWFNVLSAKTLQITSTLGGPVDVSIPAGSYNPSTAAAAFTNGLQTMSGIYLTGSVPIVNTVHSTNVVIGWNSTTKRIWIAANATAGNTTVTGSFLQDLGFSSTTVNIPSGTAVQSDVSPNLGSDRDQRFYIRLSGFENKIMLPQLPGQYFTFALALKDTGASLGYVTVPQDDHEQTLILSENQLRTNSLLKIQLVDSTGSVINLNGRNWKFVLRVEPSHKMEIDSF